MLLSILTALLSTYPFARANAGQHLIDFQVQGDICTIPQELAFPNLIVPQVLGNQSCTHHNEIKISSGPWTREPQCLEQTFCVYTNENFANGRGISFFTTPAIAKHIQALPAFTKGNIHDKANIFDNPPWEIRNVPGRGNGLFATRTLYRGDEILVDTPVGVFQSDAFFLDYQIDYKYLQKAFDQLPRKTQDIFMQTAAHSQGHPVMERINTNAFAGDFEGAPHFLMYPETAVSSSNASRGTV